MFFRQSLARDRIPEEFKSRPRLAENFNYKILLAAIEIYLKYAAECSGKSQGIARANDYKTFIAKYNDDSGLRDRQLVETVYQHVSVKCGGKLGPSKDFRRELTIGLFVCMGWSREKVQKFINSVEAKLLNAFTMSASTTASYSVANIEMDIHETIMDKLKSEMIKNHYSMIEETELRVIGRQFSR